MSRVGHGNFFGCTQSPVICDAVMPSNEASLLFVSIGTCQTWGMFESKPKTKPADACHFCLRHSGVLWQRWKSPCVSNMVVWQCDGHKLVGFLPLSLKSPPFPPISFRSRCCCSARKLISQPSMFETAAITHILTENIFQRGELWHRIRFFAVRFEVAPLDGDMKSIDQSTWHEKQTTGVMSSLENTPYKQLKSLDLWDFCST